MNRMIWIFETIVEKMTLSMLIFLNAILLFLTLSFKMNVGDFELVFINSNYKNRWSLRLSMRMIIKTGHLR